MPNDELVRLLRYDVYDKLAKCVLSHWTSPDVWPPFDAGE